MKVPLQASSALSLSISGINTALLLVSVTVVPACPVLVPRPHANPTKFMLALSACHMVTSTVLLDRALAFGTLLCVRRNPVCSLGIIFALLQPFLNKAAMAGLMVVGTTAEAEVVPAVAEHCRDDFL